MNFLLQPLFVPAHSFRTFFQLLRKQLLIGTNTVFQGEAVAALHSQMHYFSIV